MKHAVLAAALAFHPRLSWMRKPLTVVGRVAGDPLLRWLDARRASRHERAGVPLESVQTPQPGLPPPSL